MSLNKIFINNSDTNYTHSIFDISEYTGREYSDLSSALADVPTEKQSGGMTVRYVQSSDNKYVQYRLMANSFTTDVTQWQGVDDEPTIYSENLVKSGGIYNNIYKNSLRSVIYPLPFTDIALNSTNTGEVIAATNEIASLGFEVEEGRIYQIIGTSLQFGLAGYFDKPNPNNSKKLFVGIINKTDIGYVIPKGVRYILTESLPKSLENTKISLVDYNSDILSSIKDIENMKLSLDSGAYLFSKVNLSGIRKDYATQNETLYFNKTLKVNQTRNIFYLSNTSNKTCFYKIKLQNNSLYSKELLAEVFDKTAEVKSIEIPLTTLADDEYIAISGGIYYNHTYSENVYHSCLLTEGSPISAETTGFIFYEPIDARVVNNSVKNISLINDIVLNLNYSEKYNINGIVNNNADARFICRCKPEDIFEISVKSWSGESTNIGLFKSSQWSYPIIWTVTKEKVIYNVPYYARYDNGGEYDLYLLSYGEAIVDIEIKRFKKVSSYKPTTVLYNTIFNSTMPAPDFIGDGTFTADGLVIDSSGVAGLYKYYSLSNRTLRMLCKFSSDCLAKVFTSTNDTICKVDVVNQKIHINDFEQNAQNLNSNDLFLVELTKEYQRIIFKVTNIVTTEVSEIDIYFSGTGGSGAGAIGTLVNVGMQHDYYYFTSESGTYIIKQMCVVSKYCDLTLLMYGDSITEPEGYYPHSMFADAWSQLVINKIKGHAISSGRGGTQLYQISDRIKNELPFVKSKYVMVTIGTNGGNTYESLCQLVEFIINNGSIPILNHIPCNPRGTQVDVNAVIDQVRAKYNIKGIDFDKATSLNMDGLQVDISKMWEETIYNYQHHPNVKGSKAMFAQALIDVPEIFE